MEKVFKVSFKYHHIVLALVPVLVLAGVQVCHADAGIGFQASLSTLPSFVSPYDEPFYDLSVAMYPKTYPLLSPLIKRTPQLVAADRDEKSLRFNTVYYRRGRTEMNMVPVSVGADEFIRYRNRVYVRQLMRELSNKSIVASTQKQQRTGLGINVALPKRLDGIFGEGGAGLRVTGFRRITFSGRSQWTDAADNDIYRQNKFPSLNMEQVSRFDITGTIGSKISVKVSQDNQTDIPLANRIQIRYKGDDDDILKTIEAGNTTLSLPNTRFVGYSSRIRGLFGIKAAAQLGGLTVTAIASQEKGSTEKASFTPGGEDKAEWRRDYDYAEVRVFDLGLPRDALRPTDSITTLIIYELETRKDQLESPYANLWVDPSDTTLFSAEAVKLVKVTRLELNESYTFEQDRERNRHYVHFNSSRSPGKDLGYYMEFYRDGEKKIFGDISKDTLNLKLLYRSAANARPTQQTWQLMWRNCYVVPQGVDIEDMDIAVFKGRNGTENAAYNKDYQEAGGKSQKYIEILGLDQYRNGAIDEKLPDGKVDGRDEVFRKDWGLVIFPSRYPFTGDSAYVDANGDTTTALADPVESIYNYTSNTQKTDNSQYYIMIYSKARSSIISLNKANIIEGSEQVMVNGRLLKKGQDYNIQYDFGRITLLEPLDPNADITVDYEYAPFFAVQKKTLFGVRGEYEWSEDFKFGSTVLYKSDKAQERKPRVGQETAKMMVLDFDADMKFRPSILTKMVDALPLVETEVQSNLSISGEIAQSRPNPNVDDIAFVDDFESAIEDLSLGTSRTLWQKASKPLQLTADSSRGRMLWHTPRDPVYVKDVYDRQSAQGEGSLRTMRMIFRPNVKDTTYRQEIQGDDTTVVIDQITDNVRPTWNGITRFFNARVDAKRAQLFEIRARKNAGFAGKLHFDFGVVSEDLNGNGLADSEDRPPEDEAVDEAEDIGFDGRRDEEEPFYDPVNNPDPNGDNWYFLGDGKCPLSDGRCAEMESNKEWETNDSLYYEWLNGTEGNRVDVSAFGMPDQEALSISGFERNDAYFSYVIDFSDPSSRFYFDSLRVVGNEKGPWVTYRIPVRDSSYLDALVTSSPELEADWSAIKHVRVWWESSPGQATYDTIEVAAWYFVQSNWQDSVLFAPLSTQDPDSASSLVVASIGEDETPAFASTPAEPYKDPSTNVTEPRRGLLLEYTNLHRGDTCLATKDLLTVDRYSGYRRIEMYVHSDITPIDVGKIKMFFRLGSDAENFYEQQNVLHPGWDKRNWINIDFNEITGLKDDGLRALEEGQVLDVSRGTYRVRGRPNINEVRYFAVGLVNTDSTEILDGEVWLDELRVTDVRRDVGTAGRISVTGNMADLINFSFALQSQDPYFRGISAATRGGSANNLGSGKTQTSYNLNTTLTFDKFLPRSWGARIPVSVTYSKSTMTPLLRTSSDIVLPEDRRKEEQTVNESRALSVSESFRKKGKNPLFNILLNRFTSSFSYRRTLQRSVNVPYSFGENYSVSSSFDFGLTKVPTIPVFFFTKPIPLLKKIAGTRLSLYPSVWRTNANYSRNLTITDDINSNRRSALSRGFDGTMDLTYKVFENLTATYRYTTRRDLSDPELVNLSLRDFKLGIETNYSQNFTANYTPRLVGFLSTSLNYRATYRDDYNHSNKTRQANLANSWGIDGSFDHIKLLGQRASKKETRKRFNIPEDAKISGEDKGGKSFYDPPLAALRFLTGWIKPVSYKYSNSYNSSLPGVLSRPDWKYRFGLTREANVAVAGDSRSPASNEGYSWDLSSGFQLLGGLTTDVTFRQSVKKDLVTQGKRFKSTSTSWPELTLRIQRFKTLPLIKGLLNKFIDVFAPRTGYSRRIKETFNLDDAFLTNKTTTVSYNPLLSVNFKLFRALSLTGSYTLSKETDEKYNPTTGDIDSEKNSTKTSVGLSTKYSFSAPGGISIPLFGKLKFRSVMSVEINVKKNGTKTEVSNRGGPFASSVDKSDISIMPVVSYVFSQQIKGGLSGRWQDSSDNKRKQKSHIRELRIWAEIRF